MTATVACAHAHRLNSTGVLNRFKYRHCTQPNTRHTPFRPKQTAKTAAHGGDQRYPAALLDDGVQAAVDAHELIFSLRSEVSALERHGAALQTNLERLEDASAATVNGTVTTAAWAAYTAVATAKQRGGGKAPASNDDPGAKTAVVGAAVATRPAVAGGGAGKRARAERRKHAAEVLRQALGDGSGVGDESATPGAAVESEEARAVGLAREARQRAQETFVSRGVAEA